MKPVYFPTVEAADAHISRVLTVARLSGNQRLCAKRNESAKRKAIRRFRVEFGYI